MEQGGVLKILSTDVEAWVPWFTANFGTLE